MSIQFLDDEDEVLIINRRLAKAIGLNRAIALKQIHYWMKINRKADKQETHFKLGKWWTYNTYDDWQSENFDFWSWDTIQRCLVSLEDDYSLIITENFNKIAIDKTKWYSIDYEKLTRFMRLWFDHGSPRCNQGGEQSVEYAAFMEDWTEQREVAHDTARCGIEDRTVLYPVPHGATTNTRDFPETNAITSEGLQQKDAANTSQRNAMKNNRLANVPTKGAQGAVEGKESIVLYTALERKILQATRATKFTDAQRDQLDRTRTYTVSQGTTFVDQTTAAPNDLYESNEEFRKFADERIRYLKDVAHLSAGKMIDNLCDYDSKTGWFYHQSLTKPQSLPEEVENVPRQPIAGGMIKGTKTVKDIYGENWNDSI